MAIVRLESFARDLRYACRALLNSRGFTAWIVGSLALGMAVTIAALALLNAMLVLPFPGVSDQARLVRVSVSRTCGRPDCWIRMSSSSDFDTLRGGLTGLQGLAAHTQGDVAAALPEARSMRGAFTSANYFEVVGVRPAAGRLFTDADGLTKADVAVLSHSAWIREFNRDLSVIGRSIRVGDRFVHVVGVAPEHFIGIDRVRPGSRAPDLWLPMWLAEDALPLTAAEEGRHERDIHFVGRLREGVDIVQLQAEAVVLAGRLAAARGRTGEEARAEVNRVWRVRPESWHFGVIVVMPIPLLVLTIACVNAGNLMLARGSQRHREMAIRLAIGATRGRIIRQLLAESALLALAATAVALPIAWWGLDLASGPLGTPIPFDAVVLALTVMTGAGTTVAFGLWPAVRISARRPSRALGGARSDADPRESRMRRLLVIGQVTLSLGLLATAWQLAGTVRAQAVSGGTPADRLLVARFNLQPLSLAPAEVETFYDTVAAGASRLPGVEAVGVARHTSVWTFGQHVAAGSVAVWLPADAAGEGRVTIGGYAGGDLFEAVGLRVLEGRGFIDADRHGRPRAAVVNTTFAQSMDGPAVGSVLRVAPRRRDYASSIDVRVVGIIEAALEPRLEPGGPPPAKIYLPSRIDPEPALALYVRTRGSATAVAQPLRELVSQVAPRVPILEIGSLDELNERAYGTPLWLARAAAVLGVVGLILAMAGLYGVSSYVVAMRSREFAIRIAMGASSRLILALVLGQWMRLAAIGLVLGTGAAAVASRVIQSEYHGIEDLDSMAFGGAAALFIAAMLLATALPALRASRVDPIEALKEG
jgi:predicted permease